VGHLARPPPKKKKRRNGYKNARIKRQKWYPRRKTTTDSIWSTSRTFCVFQKKKKSETASPLARRGRERRAGSLEENVPAEFWKDTSKRQSIKRGTRGRAKGLREGRENPRTRLV